MLYGKIGSPPPFLFVTQADGSDVTPDYIMLRNSKINTILPSTTLVSASNWPEQSEVAAVPFSNQVVTPWQRQQVVPKPGNVGNETRLDR